MSTATSTPPAATHSHSANTRLTFPRVVRSEWIKLRTLRSTLWTLVSAVVLVVGIGLLVAAVIPSHEDLLKRAQGPDSARARLGLGLAASSQPRRSERRWFQSPCC